MINRWRPSVPAVIVGWFATRALILLQLLIWADNFLPDVRLYATWTILLSDRQFPVGDAYWQYPPGAGVLFALSRYAGPDPVFGFIVLAFIVSAVITPPDVVSQLALAIPMCILYEIGILVAQLVIKHTKAPEDAEVDAADKPAA
jgi:hypothetical protein